MLLAVPKRLLLPGIVGLFVWQTHTCLAQKYLLFHKNKYKEARYYIGEQISFELRDNPWKITRTIKSLQDTLIIFDDFSIRPDEMTSLYIDKKTRIWFVFRTKYERLFLIAGFGYLALDAINAHNLTPQTLKISAALISAGLLARWLVPKKFKLTRHRKVVIMR